MDALAQGFFRQMQEHWIQPELDKRLAAGTVTPDFVVKQCLVRLPKDVSPIVEFNEEVSIHAIVKVPDEVNPAAGDSAHLDQIERIVRIDPPLYNGQRVAWACLLTLHGKPEMFIDLSPNSPGIPMDKDVQAGLQLGIGSILHESLIELTIAEYASSQSDFDKIGLWAVPALLPYPLSKICSLLKTNKVSGARALLIAHCTPKRLTDLIANWWGTPEFAMRRLLFEQALAAHVAGQYYLSVSTLIPHIEGIMIEWLFANTTNPPDSQRARVAAFRQEFTTLVNANPNHKSVVTSTLDFIKSGPMASFDWNSPLDYNFTNRHAIGHGKFVQDLYTEENSIKVILLLDTLRQLIPPQP